MEWEYWKSAQPLARVCPMAELPIWPCQSVDRETARVERTISLLDLLTVPATIPNRYLVHAILHVCCTPCMLFSMYTVLSVCCTQLMLYSVYAVLGDNS